MPTKNKPSVIDQEVTRLEKQVEGLLASVVRLMEENRSLRAQQDSLVTERASLLEKHDMVRNRVEGIVSRLKSMESGS